jgi:hypothetical protein
VWLDQMLPMSRKGTFDVEAHIGMVKSTNHRFRVITIFRRRAGEDRWCRHDGDPAAGGAREAPTDSRVT